VRGRCVWICDSPRGRRGYPMGKHDNPRGNCDYPAGKHANPVGNRTNPVGTRGNPRGKRRYPRGVSANPRERRAARGSPFSRTAIRSGWAEAELELGAPRERFGTGGVSDGGPRSVAAVGGERR